LTAPRSDARLIDLTRPQWRPIPDADGLITVVTDPHARTAWADLVLAQDRDGFVVWSASGGKPHVMLLQVSARPGVRGIAFAQAGDDPVRVQAALRLAYRLTNETARPKEPTRVRAVSAVMPGTAEGLVHVPHLVTLRTLTGAATDTALWELLSVDAARRWFGACETDLGRLATSLPQLLAQRTATRTGRRTDDLPPSLAALLQQQPGPLTIETAVSRLDLLSHIANGEAGAR